MPGPAARGRFVWYDLITTDPHGATEFYTKVVGWGTMPWKGQMEEGCEPYVMWTAGKKTVGGRTRLPEEAIAMGAPVHWLAYVTVPDAESVVEKTEKAGGEVLMPATDMEGIGTFAILKDPQGAVFAPFTPTEGSEGEVPTPEPGHFSWHELLTTDHKGAFAFYSEVFGWEKTEAVDMGEMGSYQMFGPHAGDPFSYGGMYDLPAEMQVPPHWLYYIMVPDMGTALSAVQELGGQILGEPREVPGGDMIAQCTDPQGGVFALHSRKAGEE